MAQYFHTAIFQSTYILTLEIYKTTCNFKKEYKYTLGEKLKVISGELLDLIVLANSADKKIELLQKLDNRLETLRIHIRLAFDLKIITPGKLEIINKQIEVIGRQVGGWQKWAKQ